MRFLTIALEPYYTKISGNNIVFSGLFNEATHIYLLNPSAGYTPSDVLSISTVESVFGQNPTSDLSALASDMTASNWSNYGWNSSNFNDFIGNQVLSFAWNNFPNAYIDYLTLVYMYGNVSGTDYRLVFFYLGDYREPPNSNNISQQISWYPDGAGVNFQVGNGVTISGDSTRCAVGSRGDSLNKGRVYIYTISDSPLAVTQENVLISPSPGNNYYFGSSTTADTVSDGAPSNIQLDSTGTRLVVGEYGNNRVHVFIRSGTSWSLEQTITGSGAFGSDVSISSDGDRICVGLAGAGGTQYVYVRTGTSWSLEQSFNAGQSCRSFLNGNGDTIVSSYGGTNYIFKRSGSVWSSQGSFSGTLPILSSDGLLCSSTNGSPYTATKFSRNSTGSTWVQDSALTHLTIDTTYGYSYISPDGLYGFYVYWDTTPYASSNYLQIVKRNTVANTYANYTTIFRLSPEGSINNTPITMSNKYIMYSNNATNLHSVTLMRYR